LLLAFCLGMVEKTIDAYTEEEINALIFRDKHGIAIVDKYPLGKTYSDAIDSIRNEVRLEKIKDFIEQHIVNNFKTKPQREKLVSNLKETYRLFETDFKNLRREDLVTLLNKAWEDSVHIIETV